ncbi:required for meiotic nuclear division protein 1 homolog [Agrilus planipennis]|uniref:Required for meiotic nuclear division protein 1 homolog n=1 Tax=Agrilus planipennis TaxID=224129 RepID=A0A1W4XPF8_AGRPL|nr:required for meiotic nuclear division protein 1 homolog [Agrilus planipennis]
MSFLPSAFNTLTRSVRFLGSCKQIMLNKQIVCFKVFQNRYFSVNITKNTAQENISSLQIKKRVVRQKRPLEAQDTKTPGQFIVTALATAEEYKLEELTQGLTEQNLYEPRFIDKNVNAIYAVAKYQVDKEPREIFFFREGSVVLWNVTDLEVSNVLNFLKNYEQDSYPDKLIAKETEYMNYQHQKDNKPTVFDSNSGDFLLSTEDNILEKYTFSNVMAQSVKLGIWESMLERYIDSIVYVTEDLKRGAKLKMTRSQVLRKHGELFALRHVINLSSDLLDTPDFYWDREELEKLYLQLYSYFSINRRTKVMNEKINHCVELVELLSTHLSDKHHIRLEWMIIILIMVEVVFEVIHYVDRLGNIILYAQKQLTNFTSAKVHPPTKNTKTTL